MKDKRGSGSKENVGRPKLTYETVHLRKVIPKEIENDCLDYIEEKVTLFKKTL